MVPVTNALQCREQSQESLNRGLSGRRVLEKGPGGISGKLGSRAVVLRHIWLFYHRYVVGRLKVALDHPISRSEGITA